VVRFDDTGEGDSMRAVLELDGRGGACLRGAVFWSDVDRDGEAARARERELLEPLGGTPTLTSTHGRLIGRTVAPSGDTPLACRWAR
jgi:hypothetical protein